MKEGKILSINYPIFALEWFHNKKNDENFIFLAGGGGSAKSGVKNLVTICKLCEGENSKPAFKVLSVIDTGSNLVSNITVSPNGNLLACGTNGQTVVYRGDETKMEKFTEFTTDFSKSDPHQNVVQFSPKKNYIATGGDDGVVRLWKIPETLLKGISPRKNSNTSSKNVFNELHALKGHTSPVNALDWHPSGDIIASSSKDGYIYVWNSSSGKKMCRLPEAQNTIPANIKKDKKCGKYIYRSCRFARNADKENMLLITLQTPARGISFLGKWSLSVSSNTADCTMTKMISIGKLAACSLTTCDRFIGVGGSDGSINLYDISMLQCQRRITAHHLPVTGLAFKPWNNDEDEKEIRLLLSASADYTINVLHVKESKYIFMILLIFFLLIIIGLVYYYFSSY